MMTRDRVALLEYEATKRPEIAEMISRLHLMSEDEVKDLRTPLPWFRQAMLELRLKKIIQTGEIEYQTGFQANPEGHIREWFFGNEFVNLGKGELEMTPGQIIFVIPDVGIWIDTIFVTRIDPRLLSRTKPLGGASRTTYMDALQSRRNRLQVTPEAVSPKPLWTIRRH